MSGHRSFTPAMFAFLRDLRANNDRDWFKANKEHYENDVKERALEFVNDFAPYLDKISPHFVADSRPVGGSLFRIHRDTRFSKDKTPYKTHAGLHFRHELAKDVHAPGFYLHLEPGSVYAGLGIWHPDSETAAKVRDAIAAEPGRWKRVAHAKPFTDVYRLEGESLKRSPRGHDPDHPLIEDLKRKDFIGGTGLTQRTVTSPGFVEEYAALCRAGAPFVEFLCDAIGVPF
ncbi:MAG: DUF2461 domain-containing protein [Acidimicrobiia bacterium]